MYKLLPILLFAYGLAVTTDDIYDNSYALIIGIDKYENISNLDYAVDDANSIKKMLIDKFQFSSDKITLLLNKDATYRKIKKALSKVTRKADENDRILIFFSGHGETFSLPEGGAMGFLIPVDGEKDDLYATSLEMDELRRVTSLSKAKHILYLVDACYGGLAVSNTRSLDISVPGFLEKITRDKSRQIITAGGRGEQVIEKAEWGHSAFTLNILRGLNDWTADTNWDGFITAEELGIFLKNRVTKDSNGQQTPVSARFTSHEGEFVFINNSPTQIINNPTSNSISVNQKIEQIIIDFQEFTKHGIIEIDGTPISVYRDSLINELQLGETNGSDNSSFDNSSFNEIILELKKEIALLREKQVEKTDKFIQGCINEMAINYNPEANLDDNSCITLEAQEAYLNFGEYKDSDSTIYVMIQTGIGSQLIRNINFSISGFEIIDFVSGEIINNQFNIATTTIDKISSFSVSGGKSDDYNDINGFDAAYQPKLLFEAKIIPHSKELCLNDAMIYAYSEGYGYPALTGDCLEIVKPSLGFARISYSSDHPIGRFHFTLVGVKVRFWETGFGIDDIIFGGSAEEANMFLMSRNNIIYGESDDKIIPAGEGLLLIVKFEGNASEIQIKSSYAYNDSEILIPAKINIMEVGKIK